MNLTLANSNKETWDFVEVTSWNWVFKKKVGIQGVDVARFKANLAAKCFNQRKGLEFHEVFSFMVKQTSVG